MIAEVRLLLVAHLLGRRLLAMLGLGGVVLDAHLADVELGVAGLAHIEAAKGEAESRERSAAAPADEGVGHGLTTTK